MTTADRDAQIESMQKSIEKLNRALKTAKIVAAFFGLTGAIGLSVLRYEYNQITKLQEGIKPLLEARDSSIRAIDIARDNSLTLIKENSTTLAHDAISQEMKKQIGDVKYWTKNVYDQAGSLRDVTNGAVEWQHRLADKSSEVEAALK